MGLIQPIRRGPAGYKTFFRALLPALSFLLAGADAPKPGKTIVVFGDSLTAGHGLPGGATAAWPAQLGAALAAKHPEWTVVNAGLSGETSAGGLRRIDWVLKRKADVFVLELGGNDGLRGLPTEEMDKNLRGILDKVRAKYPDAKLVVAGMKMPPAARMDAGAFGSVFPKIAADYRATLIPFILDGVAGEPELMQDDGIHPNAKGHAVIAGRVRPVVEPLLK